MTDQSSIDGGKSTVSGVTRRGFMRAAGAASIGVGIATRTADAQQIEPWEDVRDNWDITDDRCKNCLLLICDETFSDLFNGSGIWSTLQGKLDRIEDLNHRNPIGQMLADLASMDSPPTVRELFEKNRDGATANTDEWPPFVKSACDGVAETHAALPFFWVPDDRDMPAGVERTKIRLFLANNSSGGFWNVFGDKTFYQVFTRQIDSTPAQVWRLHLLRAAKELGILRYHPVERDRRLIEHAIDAGVPIDALALDKGKCARFTGFEWVCEASNHEDDLCGTIPPEGGQLEQGSDLCT